MNEEVLFLKSPLKEKIYGGTRIQERFGFHDVCDKKIGEYWAISAHDNGPSIVTNGGMKGKTLKEVYDKHRELFGNAKEERFPLLVKINEITSPVSVQVHPDDTYAMKYENDLGKAEFCLFLEVEDGTEIIRGHSAKNKEEFKMLCVTKQWDKLLSKKKVKTNDYVFTPAGVIHGVEGTMLMAEVQQSSDITYRIYDYDNVDIDGKPRELHLNKALQTTMIPHVEPVVNVKITKHGNTVITNYVDTEFFRVTRYEIQENENILNKKYSLCLVLKGKGSLVINNQKYNLDAGMGFIITSKTRVYEIEGNVDMLVSEPPCM